MVIIRLLFIISHSLEYSRHYQKNTFHLDLKRFGFIRRKFTELFSGVGNQASNVLL